MEPNTTLRAGDKSDLPAINAVIERAVMTWRLPDRVKRLSLPRHSSGAWVSMVCRCVMSPGITPCASGTMREPKSEWTGWTGFFRIDR
ncbi:hypothetical protein [Thioalkalivibrio denitrificans]|nr:hypothetical protein [Thioalkalivibrio denitrificans]